MRANRFLLLMSIVVFSFPTNPVASAEPEGAGVDRYGNTPLHQAAERGDVEKVRLLLDSKPKTDLENRHGQTPLSLAARNGKLEVVEMLTAAGASISRKNKDGSTPMWEAAAHGKYKVVQYFLKKKADVNARDKYGRTLLHLAARKGDEALARIAIAYKGDVNAHNKGGMTPLHEAAMQKRRVEVVRLLLAAKAKPDIKGRWDKRPLHTAVWSGNFEMVKLLVEAGANVNALRAQGTRAGKKAKKKKDPGKKKDPPKEDKRSDYEKQQEQLRRKEIEYHDFRSPLDDAIQIKNRRIQAYLREKGARNAPKPKKKGPKRKVSVVVTTTCSDIFSAVSQDDPRKIREFARMDRQAVDSLERGCTPLMKAAEYNKAKAAKTLIGLGASVNGPATTTHAGSPLISAACNGNPDITRLLLAKGADPALGRYEGETPLHYAALYGDLETIKMLAGALQPGNTAIAEADIYPWPALLYSMSKSRSSGTNPGHEAVYPKLSPDLQREIGTIRNIKAEPNAKLKAAVIAELNGLLLTKGLYSQKAWRYCAVHDKADALLAKLKEDTIKEEDLRVLNRILLESAFRNCLRKTQSNDVNIPSRGGRTPLHEVAEGGEPKTVEFLLAQGANVHSTTTLAVTPLHVAAQNGNYEVMELLLKAGAKVDAQDSQKRTALYLAAEEGMSQAVRVLLKHGANPKQKAHRYTPAERAREYGRVAAYILLKKAEAKP